jgi:hypothetical protein
MTMEKTCPTEPYLAEPMRLNPIVQLTDNQIEYCRHAAQVRLEKKYHGKTLDVFERNKELPKYRLQVMGEQAAAAYYAPCKWNSVYERPYGWLTLDNLIQVRVRDNGTDDLPVYGNDRDGGYYLLVSPHGYTYERRFRLTGWIKGGDGKRGEWRRQRQPDLFEHGDVYDVQHRYLHHAEALVPILREHQLNGGMLK